MCFSHGTKNCVPISWLHVFGVISNFLWDFGLNSQTHAQCSDILICMIKIYFQFFSCQQSWHEHSMKLKGSTCIIRKTPTSSRNGMCCSCGTKSLCLFPDHIYFGYLNFLWDLVSTAKSMHSTEICSSVCSKYIAKSTQTFDKVEGFYFHSKKNTNIFIKHLAQHTNCNCLVWFGMQKSKDETFIVEVCWVSTMPTLSLFLNWSLVQSWNKTSIQINYLN